MARDSERKRGRKEEVNMWRRRQGKRERERQRENEGDGLKERQGKREKR